MEPPDPDISGKEAGPESAVNMKTADKTDAQSRGSSTRTDDQQAWNNWVRGALFLISAGIAYTVLGMDLLKWGERVLGSIGLPDSMMMITLLMLPGCIWTLKSKKGLFLFLPALGFTVYFGTWAKVHDFWWNAVPKNLYVYEEHSLAKYVLPEIASGLLAFIMSIVYTVKRPKRQKQKS